jgi:uncharacterized RDD family membrane protein YckC
MRVRSVTVEETASLARRFGALLVDWILCLLIAGAFNQVKHDPWFAPGVLVVEYGFFLGLFGQTPGMWSMRIRCVSITTGQAIGIPRALLRGLLLALFIPALIMGSDQRGLHDKAAGSVIVPVAPKRAETVRTDAAPRD